MNAGLPSIEVETLEELIDRVDSLELDNKKLVKEIRSLEYRLGKHLVTCEKLESIVKKDLKCDSVEDAFAKCSRSEVTKCSECHLIRYFVDVVVERKIDPSIPEDQKN